MWFCNLWGVNKEILKKCGWPTQKKKQDKEMYRELQGDF